MTPLPRRPILFLFFLCLLAPFAQARVFESLGRQGQGRYESLPGWTRAHASTWTFNGGRTDVEVWNVSLPLGQTLERLRADAARQGDVSAFFPGTAMAWGVAGGGGRVTRFICNEMESGRQTLVFRFSQTDEDFKRSRAGPADVRLPESIPVMPGARAEFVATGSEGATLAVFTVPGGETDARDFLARSLGQAGWTPALGAGTSPQDGLGFYIRGTSLCGFSAKMSRHDGACVVTVWHRRLNRGD